MSALLIRLVYPRWTVTNVTTSDAPCVGSRVGQASVVNTDDAADLAPRE